MDGKNYVTFLFMSINRLILKRLQKFFSHDALHYRLWVKSTLLHNKHLG